ncbi:hypothetical protein D3C80_491060 [compost metagenome]
MSHQQGDDQQQADEHQLRQIAERFRHAQQGEAEGEYRQHAIERPPGKHAQAAQACRGLVLESTGAVARGYLLQCIDQQAAVVARHPACRPQVHAHSAQRAAARPCCTCLRLAPQQQPQALDQQTQRVTQGWALARQLRVQALALGQQRLPGG